MSHYERLLSRDEFRKTILERSRGKCVFCGDFAVDAHHILDRKLFSDGGYYNSNGVAVCEPCHIKCERTDIPVEEIRATCHISLYKLPEGIEKGVKVDKWGNEILSNGQRLKGPMFHEENVQKILSDKMSLFTDYVKYPRTPHLPWSEGATDDDIRLKYEEDWSEGYPLAGLDVIATEKMDGENTTLYPDHIHARSIDSVNHPSRNWVKNFWSGFKHDIPEGYRICGENLYARHSIQYYSLKSYFYGFSMWDNKNTCLGWDETVEWFNLLGIEPVPVLYRDQFCIRDLKALAKSLDLTKQEGYVVRTVAGFHFSEFQSCVNKWVRAGHVQTDEHWMNGPVVKNLLMENP